MFLYSRAFSFSGSEIGQGMACMRRIRELGYAIAATAAVCSMPASAAGIAVPLDQVRMVSFNKPVSTVYVGNPMVADVTVVDSRHVFVLGKAFGSTNVIALDAQGKQISDRPLSVYGGSAHMVTLNRGAAQLTYACAASRCETAPVPGDAPAPYSAVMGEVSQHQDMGQKAAAANTGR